MDVTHAAAIALGVGHTGTWVGPLLVGAAAGLLDYSAAGPAAVRDRIAVAGYYASAVSFAELTGWTPWIRATVATYDWRMVGALANLITVGALLIVWVGRPKAVAGQLGAKIGFGTTGSKAAAKINQTLLGWTVAAALTSPMAGTGGWGSVVDWITTATTGMWSAIVRALLSGLGG